MRVRMRCEGGRHGWRHAFVVVPRQTSVPDCVLVASISLPRMVSVFTLGGEKVATLERGLSIGAARLRLAAHLRVPILSFELVRDGTVSSIDDVILDCDAHLTVVKLPIRCAAVSVDGEVKIWCAETGVCLSRLAGPVGAVLSVAVSPDGDRLLAGSCDGTSKIWCVETGACLSTLRGHVGTVVPAAFSPDGSRALTGSSLEKSAKIWCAATGACLSTLEGHADSVLSVAFSPDGGRALTGSRDGTSRVWSALTGECRSTLDRHEAEVHALSFSPCSGRVLTGSRDLFAAIWSAETGERLLTLEGHCCGIMAATFSADGGSVLTGSSDGVTIRWSAETGERLLALAEGLEEELEGLEGPASVSSMAFSPDGRYVLSGFPDGAVEIRHTETGRPSLSLEGRGDAVRSVAFSPGRGGG